MVAKTDFAICEGNYITDTRSGPISLNEGDSPRYAWTDVSRANGVSFQRSRIRFQDVTDGLSQTFLIGEKSVGYQSYCDNSDLGYDQSLLSGVDLDLNRWSINEPVSDRMGSSRSFGSAHRTAFNISYCDGSARAIDYLIDFEVFSSLGDRNGGKAIARIAHE